MQVMQAAPDNRIGQWAKRLGEYRRWAHLAKTQTGKDTLTQWRDIRMLKDTGGRCGLSDYYGYKLYDDAYLQGAGQHDFLGWCLQANFSLALNPRMAVLPAWDKYAFMLMASAAGLPVAPVQATFHRATRIAELMGRHLKTAQQAADFLRNPQIYPLFGKPVFSQQGYGSAYLSSYEPATDCISLLDGTRVPTEEFVQRLTHSTDKRYHKPECGYLFQAPFTLAPEIKTLTDWPAICGVRVICLNGSQGVRPIRAIWKIATPPNHVDNFSLGKYGNLLANVDLETGEVSKVIGGFWPDTQVHTHHPLTGQSMQGFRLPGWTQILQACQNGGAAFPLMKIHHWDFALTDQGPLVLELNDLGGTEIAQVHGHGLLTEETRAFIKQHANAQAHPWVKAL